MEESTYPYEGRDGQQCRFKFSESSFVNVHDDIRLEKGNIDQMKAALTS